MESLSWLSAPRARKALGSCAPHPNALPVRDVATARDGTSVAVFPRPSNGFTLIYAAMRPPGGTFGPATPISDDGVSASSPHVAINDQGNATAVWRRGGVPQAAYRRRGDAAWQPAQSLTGDTTTGGVNVAVGATGLAIAS